jgi:hypothetical protein
LLFGVCVCGYKFLAARPGASPGADLHPRIRRRDLRAGTVFLAPEILHFAIIFFAYFLWLCRRSPDARHGCAGEQRHAP